MRILHVVTPAPFGGLETVVRTLASGLRVRGEDVAVALLLEAGIGEPPLAHDLRTAGVPIHPIVLPPRSYWSQCRELRRLVRNLRPQIIHSHGYVADVIVGAVRTVSHVPTASTTHGFTGGGRKNRVYEWLQVQSLRRFDSVAAVSSSIRSRLLAEGLRSERVHLIRNALAPSSNGLSRHEARRELGIPDDVVAIGWVGRISHEKGLDVLVSALGDLADLTFRVVVIGEGRERRAVEELAETLGVASRLHWVGSVPDAARLMRAFDIFALTSRTEGTPITLLEAIYASVPVVACAVGGVPDVISGAEGLLVAADRPAELAFALREVLTQPREAATRAGRAAERLARDFSLETWLDSYQELYRMVVRPAHDRSA
jgi:glycosyltransferase involved in cell wall biosynthesis